MKQRRRSSRGTWNGEDRRGWHFEKSLSLDTFVAIFGIALVVGGPVLVWGRAMESRVQALEVMQGERQKGDVAKEADVREQRAQLALRLDKLDEKVTSMQIQLGRFSPGEKK